MLQGLETWTLHFPESLDSRILILLLPVRDLEGKSGEATIAIATMAHAHVRFPSPSVTRGQLSRGGAGTTCSS